MRGRVRVGVRVGVGVRVRVRVAHVAAGRDVALDEDAVRPVGCAPVGQRVHPEVLYCHGAW